MADSEIKSVGKAKFIIAMTVFIDVLGIGIVAPGLPIYLKGLIESPFWIESFFTVYALCGFFAAPILGALSDRYGRRPVLLSSILGTSIGWFIFALGSGNIIFLVLGRVIDGFTSGNISTAHTYLVDIAKTPQERTTNLGIIGAVFGIGFIIGPGIGGVLSKVSVVLPFYITACLALVNVIAAYFFLPETNMSKDHSRKVNLNPFTDIKKIFANSSIRVFFVVWALYSLCFAIMQSVFSLYGSIAYGFSATTNGLFLTLSGVLIAINQGFLLKNLWLKKFSEKQLEVWGSLVLALSYLAIMFGNFYLLIAGLVFSSFAQALVRVVNNSTISRLSPQDKLGETMGVVQSIMFLSAIVAPLVGGVALEFSVKLPWFISGVLMICAFLILNIRYLRRRDIV